MKARITLENITKYYETFLAVNNISFEISEGEVFGLLGPNGAGKTTTLRMISGMLQPSEGNVFIDGFSMKEQTLSAKKSLGFLTGDMNLYERLNPIELLTYFANLYLVEKPEIKNRVEELVEKFEIHEYANRLCGKLSTGQKQRVAIARTVIHDPAVIVLDEPTTGLDIMSSELILNFIKKASQEDKKTVIFSTHNLSEVERLASRIGVINKGNLKFSGTINEINNLTKQESLSESFFNIVQN